MREGMLDRLPKPIAMMLKLLWTIALTAGALLLGGVIGKQMMQPRWEPVISFSGSICFMILVLANPVMGLLLWIVTAPFFGFALLHISLGRGIPDLSLSRLVIALLVALVAAQVATGRRKIARITRTDFLVVVSVAGIGVSIVGATSRDASLAWYFESFLMPVLTYLVARNLITDERKIQGAQRALVAVAVLIALVVIQEQVIGYSWFPTTGSTAYGKHLRRVTGLLGNPAFHAVILSMTLPFVWRAMLSSSVRRNRRLLLIALGVVYAGLFLTYNRTGWLGAVLGVIIFLIFVPRFRKPFLRLTPLLAIALVVYWTQISTSYAFTERLVAVNPITYRLDTFKLAIDVFQTYPIAGIGFGNLWYVSGLSTPHNTFLWVLVSTGILGFFPFVGQFAMMGWDSLRHYRKAPDLPGLDRDLVVALWVSLLAYLAQVFAVDMLYGIYSNIIFFFIAGSVFGYLEAIVNRSRLANKHLVQTDVSGSL